MSEKEVRKMIKKLPTWFLAGGLVLAPLLGFATWQLAGACPCGDACPCGAACPCGSH